MLNDRASAVVNKTFLTAYNAGMRVESRNVDKHFLPMQLLKVLLDLHLVAA